MEVAVRDWSLREESLQLRELNERLECYLQRVSVLEQENQSLQRQLRALRSAPTLSRRCEQEHQLEQLRAQLAQGWREAEQAALARDSLAQELRLACQRQASEASRKEEARRRLAERRRELEEERRGQEGLETRVKVLEGELRLLEEQHQEEVGTLQEQRARAKPTLAPSPAAPCPGFAPPDLGQYTLELSQAWKDSLEVYLGRLERGAKGLNLQQEAVREEKRENWRRLQALEREVEVARERRTFLEAQSSQQNKTQQQELQQLQLRIGSLEGDRDELAAKMDQILGEHRQLLQAKLALNMEVATYRALLDFELGRIHPQSVIDELTASLRDAKGARGIQVTALESAGHILRNRDRDSETCARPHPGTDSPADLSRGGNPPEPQPRLTDASPPEEQDGRPPAGATPATGQSPPLNDALPERSPRIWWPLEAEGGKGGAREEEETGAGGRGVNGAVNGEAREDSEEGDSEPVVEGVAPNGCSLGPTGGEGSQAEAEGEKEEEEERREFLRGQLDREIQAVTTAAITGWAKGWGSEGQQVNGDGPELAMETGLSQEEEEEIAKFGAESRGSVKDGGEVEGGEGEAENEGGSWSEGPTHAEERASLSPLANGEGLADVPAEAPGGEGPEEAIDSIPGREFSQEEDAGPREEAEGPGVSEGSHLEAGEDSSGEEHPKQEAAEVARELWAEETEADPSREDPSGVTEGKKGPTSSGEGATSVLTLDATSEGEKVPEGPSQGTEGELTGENVPEAGIPPSAEGLWSEGGEGEEIKGWVDPEEGGMEVCGIESGLEEPEGKMEAASEDLMPHATPPGDGQSEGAGQLSPGGGQLSMSPEDLAMGREVSVSLPKSPPGTGSLVNLTEGPAEEGTTPAFPGKEEEQEGAEPERVEASHQQGAKTQVFEEAEGPRSGREGPLEGSEDQEVGGTGAEGQDLGMEVDGCSGETENSEAAEGLAEPETEEGFPAGTAQGRATYDPKSSTAEEEAGWGSMVPQLGEGAKEGGASGIPGGVIGLRGGQFPANGSEEPSTSEEWDILEASEDLEWVTGEDLSPGENQEEFPIRHHPKEETPQKAEAVLATLDREGSLALPPGEGEENKEGTEASWMDEEDGRGRSGVETGAPAALGDPSEAVPELGVEDSTEMAGGSQDLRPDRAVFFTSEEDKSPARTEEELEKELLKEEGVTLAPETAVYEKTPVEETPQAGEEIENRGAEEEELTEESEEDSQVFKEMKAERPGQDRDHEGKTVSPEEEKTEDRGEETEELTEESEEDGKVFESEEKAAETSGQDGDHKGKTVSPEEEEMEDRGAQAEELTKKSEEDGKVFESEERKAEMPGQDGDHEGKTVSPEEEEMENRGTEAEELTEESELWAKEDSKVFESEERKAEMPGQDGDHEGKTVSPEEEEMEDRGVEAEELTEESELWAKEDSKVFESEEGKVETPGQDGDHEGKTISPEEEETEDRGTEAEELTEESELWAKEDSKVFESEERKAEMPGQDGDHEGKTVSPEEEEMEDRGVEAEELTEESELWAKEDSKVFKSEEGKVETPGQDGDHEGKTISPEEEETEDRGTEAEELTEESELWAKEDSKVFKSEEGKVETPGQDGDHEGKTVSPEEEEIEDRGVEAEELTEESELWAKEDSKVFKSEEGKVETPGQDGDHEGKTISPEEEETEDRGTEAEELTEESELWAKEDSKVFKSEEGKVETPGQDGDHEGKTVSPEEEEIEDRGVEAEELTEESELWAKEDSKVFESEEGKVETPGQDGDREGKTVSPEEEKTENQGAEAEELTEESELWAKEDSKVFESEERKAEMPGRDGDHEGKTVSPGKEETETLEGDREDTDEEVESPEVPPAEAPGNAGTGCLPALDEVWGTSERPEMEEELLPTPLRDGAREVGGQESPPSPTTQPQKKRVPSPLEGEELSNGMAGLDGESGPQEVRAGTLELGSQWEGPNEVPPSPKSHSKGAPLYEVTAPWEDMFAEASVEAGDTVTQEAWMMGEEVDLPSCQLLEEPGRTEFPATRGSGDSWTQPGKEEAVGNSAEIPARNEGLEERGDLPEDRDKTPVPVTDPSRIPVMPDLPPTPHAWGTPADPSTPATPKDGAPPESPQAEEGEGGEDLGVVLLDANEGAKGGDGGKTEGVEGGESLDILRERAPAIREGAGLLREGPEEENVVMDHSHVLGPSMGEGVSPDKAELVRGTVPQEGEDSQDGSGERDSPGESQLGSHDRTSPGRNGEASMEHNAEDKGPGELFGVEPLPGSQDLRQADDNRQEAAEAHDSSLTRGALSETLHLTEDTEDEELNEVDVSRRGFSTEEAGVGSATLAPAPPSPEMGALGPKLRQPTPLPSEDPPTHQLNGEDTTVQANGGGAAAQTLEAAYRYWSSEDE